MTSESTSEPVAQPKTPPSTAGMTTKVVKGSMWTLAGQVAPLAVSLVTTPFVIRMLGSEGYGVLILIGLIPTYLGFADLGMSMASTKFGSEAYAEGDEEKEARIVRTAALIALTSSVPISAALMIFASPLISLFNVPEALQGEAVLALRIAAVTFVINFLCTIFNTPQLARLRMDLNTLINATSRILGLIATPIVIYLGYGIVGAMIVLFASSLLNLLGHLVITKGMLPELLGCSVDSGAFRSLAWFGASFAGAGVVIVLLNNLEKGLISVIVSVESLAYYTVAFTLAGMLFLFANSMVQSLIPAFSQLQAEEARGRLNALYSRGLRITLIIALPTLTLLFIVGKTFFAVWAGPDFAENSTLPFYFLLLGLLFNIPAYLPHAMIIAAGRTDVFYKLYLAEFVPYVIVVTVCTFYWGIVGAAIAWSTRMIADSLIQFTVAKRLVGLPDVTTTLAKVVMSSLTLAPALIIAIWYDELNLPVVMSLFLCFVFYLISLYWLAFDPDEIGWLKAKLRACF